VVAFDADTGERVWHFRRQLPEGLKLCCGHPNRGAAILHDTLFITTLDAHLVALDAATGAKRWETRVADASEGYSITGAPLAFGDRVVVGVAGSLFGVRGQIAAYSARDGRLLWRFWTVPEPGEPGHETWTDASWRTGGAATWTVGSYDAALDLVLWGVGNPAPVFDGDLRKGDNLYSNSVVALDASSGRLRWHYQFTPNDEHDWDAAQQPVLTNVLWRGERRPAVLWANRNGFFYALDRRSGEFLFARSFVKQTWNDGFDAKGRPNIRADSKPSVKGTLVWPVVGGATSWWPPSLDPARRLMFVPAIEAAGMYFKGGHPDNIPLVAGVSKGAANQPSWAGIAAIDIDSGQTRWKATLSYGENVFRAVGGILSTESGVLFAGYQDVFYAFDARDGRVLWSRRLGARVSGPPIAYRAGGRDHVAVTAGNSLFVFATQRAAAPAAPRDVTAAAPAAPRDVTSLERNARKSAR
jgi:alcohol dehydrogenase (cytochrome c)